MTEHQRWPAAPGCTQGVLMQIGHAGLFRFDWTDGDTEGTDYLYDTVTALYSGGEVGLEVLDGAPVRRSVVVTSFAAQRTANLFSRRDSVQMGQPSPENIESSVDVSVSGVSTALTSKLCLGDAVVLGCVPAGVAALGRVLGVHCDHGPPSVFRFGSQDRQELCPARVEYGSVEAALGGHVHARCIDGALRRSDHVGDRQFLYGDQIMGRNEPSSGLMMPVTALVADFAMAVSDRPDCRLPIPGAPLLDGKPLLRSGEPVGCVLTVTGVWDLVAVAVGQEAGDSHVDPDDRTRSRQRVSGYLVTGQDEEPTAPLPLDLHRLDPALDFPVGGDFHVPDALEVDAGVFAVPLAGVAMGGPDNGVEPVGRFEPRVPRGLAGFDPSEECLHGPVEFAEGCLFGSGAPAGNVGSDRSDERQVSGLIFELDPNPCLSPRLPPLLEGSVVQLPMRVEAIVQGYMLTAGRPHPELVGSLHRHQVPSVCRRGPRCVISTRGLRHSTIEMPLHTAPMERHPKVEVVQ